LNLWLIFVHRNNKVFIIRFDVSTTQIQGYDLNHNNAPATLHFTTGFPVVIGLRHIKNLSKIRVSEPGQEVTIRTSNNEVVKNFGITHGYHHYLIATRPRCMVIENSFYWDRANGIGFGLMEFETGYKKYKNVPFKLILDGTCPYPFPSTDKALKSHKDINDITIEKSGDGYPNRFLIHSKSGKKFGYYLEPDFLHFIKFDENKVERLLDFRVEYIGISTGKSGNRDFGDRLKNHEKIIEISSFIQRDHPNRQIYIFGYQAQYSIEVVPDSFINSSKMLETHLPEKMKSTAEVLEACLIKHFQPKYNTEFKNFLVESFPCWLKALREILVPKYDFNTKRPARISASIFSDNMLNAEGSWQFGNFYSEHTVTSANYINVNYDIQA